MPDKNKTKVAIFWFRRDLRLEDNTGLHHALSSVLPVLPLFIFDSNILDDLENKSDPRVMFIHDQLTEIHATLSEADSGMVIRKGKPEKIFKSLIKEYPVEVVYTNEDYEPYGIERDRKINELLRNEGIEFKKFQDHVIYAKDQILNNQDKPYKVFTPYKDKWIESLTEDRLKSVNSKKHFRNFISTGDKDILSLGKIGFKRSSIPIPSKSIDLDLIKQYDKHRNFPSMDATTRLGIHLRHGTISIREIVSIAKKHNTTWLNELIWREFYIMILYHFPSIVNKSFKEKYDKIPWENDEENFKRWCDGQTGYPMVDAGMRQLNQTGFMHNRARMIAASFLTKHLLIDWRWGEAYFAKKLLDYELASNNGGWQWAAGTGTDAQPYFRIFNPEEQAKKYDPDAKYIKEWIPEINTKNYPDKIIDHKFARERAIKLYKEATG